jgi:phage terminase small subunit
VPAGVKIPQAALLHALKEAGWIDVGRLNSKEYQNKKHIFAAPEALKKYSKAELRRMAEELPKSGIMPNLGKN